MSITIPLIGPGGEPVDFLATINSHGVTTLPPAKPNAEMSTELQITLRLADDTIRTVVLRQGERGTVNIAVPGNAPVDEHLIVNAVRRLLRLDHDLSDFYALASADPLLDWVGTGYGRMMRCQTVFEDVVKTILTTNCAWSATVRMMAKLVTELGDTDPLFADDPPYGRAFPTAAQMARQDEAFYREVIRAGYRAPHLVKLANAVASGELDLESLATVSRDDLSDSDMEKQLLALPGVGPYSAAHIMHMLGRQSRLVLDSWTRPTYARIIGVETIDDKAIAEAFERYGDYAGLAYWMVVTKVWFDRQTAAEAL